jgi:uncharacterized protein YndB with AHSA1/START domain
MRLITLPIGQGGETVAKVERSILINAPVEKVFAYINDPANLPEIWPSMIEAKEIERLPNGGNRFRWVYKMAGMRFEGSSEDTECVANERVVSETKGGIESTIAWLFQPEAGGTRATNVTDYTVPIPLLGKLAESFIVRQNENEIKVLMANLKDRMEA